MSLWETRPLHLVGLKRPIASNRICDLKPEPCKAFETHEFFSRPSGVVRDRAATSGYVGCFKFPSTFGASGGESLVSPQRQCFTPRQGRDAFRKASDDRAARWCRLGFGGAVVVVSRPVSKRQTFRTSPQVRRHAAHSGGCTRSR